MKRIVALILVLLIMLPLVVACNKDSKRGQGEKTSGNDGSDSNSESNSDVEQKEEIVYSIVYPTACSVELKNLAKDIKSRIKKDHGLTLNVGNDREGATTATAYEILVGDTNRTESALGYEKTGGGGWWVSTEGNRIVINGGTVKEIAEAIDYFFESYDCVDGNIVFDDSKEKFVEGQNELNRKNITLRVGSYNVKKGIQGKGEQVDDFSDANIDANIIGIAEDIKALNLDIVGLQEIDVGTGRTGGRDFAKLIAEAAGYQYYQFTKAIDFDDGAYGSAIISKYEIVEYETVILPRDPNVDGEDRAVGIATVNYNGNKIKFLNTHLTVSEDAAGLEAKIAQMRKIAEVIEGQHGFILTGDFNTSDTSIRSLISDTRLVNNGVYRSFNNANPIDDIVLESGWKIIDSGMNDAVDKGHSDHNMIWAEIKYTGGK